MVELPAVGVELPAVEVERPSLFAWATGSLHAALLVALGVAGLHLSGALGDLLGGLGTLPGAVAYCYLWGVTVVATDQALRQGEISPVGGVPDARGAATAALVWGGTTGLAMFAPVLVLVAGLLLFNVGIGAALAVFVVAVLGSLVAAAVGALVGGLFALLDVALLRAAALVAG
jgi:hypothetical protein